MSKRINWFVYILLFSLILISQNNFATASPNNSPSNFTFSRTEKSKLKAIVKQRTFAYAREDWETVLSLMSRDSRLQAFDGLFIIATFRGLDNDYQEDTGSLKAKINELRRTTGVYSREEIVDASIATQAAYYKALYDSLEEILPSSLKSDITAGTESDFELEILALEDNLAIAKINRNDRQTSVVKFIKDRGSWLFATTEEIDLARLPEGNLSYVAPGLLPLTETVPLLSDRQVTATTADWYDTLPPVTAAEKNIQVGDVVLAYIEERLGRDFDGFRVVSIQKGKQGDLATLIRQDKSIFSNVPLALLHEVEDYIDRDRQLEIDDAVFVTKWGGITYARVSDIEDGQISIKYAFMDEVKEEISSGIVLPVPKSGYLFRKVLYRYDGKTDVGVAIAESANKVWIDVSSSLGVIGIDKTDAKPIELPDANLGTKKVWATSYRSIRPVQIIRIIEPGLLYEIDEQNFDDEYRLLPFDNISIKEPFAPSKQNN